MFVPDIADEALMTEVIRAHVERLGLPPGAGRCRLVDAQIRHSHRPTSSRCRGWATYEVPTGETSALLYVRGYPDGSSGRPWVELVAAGKATGATHLPAHDLIVWKFPHDPSLSRLTELVDPDRVADRIPAGRLRALAGRRVRPRAIGVDVVRYQPETSATVRYHIAGEPDSEPVTVYAKALNTDPTEIGELHQRLWDRSAQLPRLRIAQPLGIDPHLRVLWTVGVPGVNLGADVDPGEVAALARGVAETTAALHRSGVLMTHVVHWQDCLAEGVKKATKLAEALPQFGSALAAMAPPADLSVPSAAAVVVHGDLHLEQFLRGPDGPVLVDLDSVAAGDAELDLAELVVDVVMRSLPLDAGRVFVFELLEAYEREALAGPVRLPLLRALADAEFLTRCHRHLRRRSPGWELDVERALERHAVLAGALPVDG